MKHQRNVIIAIAVLGLCFSLYTFANDSNLDLSGEYSSKDGVVIAVTKISDISYSVTSDHSKNKAEAGHNWSGVAMLSSGKFIGLFKYPDNDSKYQGFLGVQDGELKDNCLIITGSQYTDTLTLQGSLGPFTYCKIQ